jgi:hypothetical protein
MKRILKKIDFFPQNFSLSLNGKGLKNTMTGGLLTFLSLFSSLIISIILINDFIYNRKITLISQTLYDIEMHPLEIKPSDLQFIYSLWDSQNFLIQPSALSYSHIVQLDLDVKNLLSNQNDSEAFRVKRGEFSPCSSNNTSSDFNVKDFKALGYNVSEIYCTNLNNMTTDHLLSGGNLVYKFKEEVIHFYFEIDSCKMNPVNCTNTTFMNDNSKVILMMFKDNYFNVMEPKGFTSFLNTYFLPFRTGKNIDLYIDLIKNELITDNSLFLKNEEKSNFISFDNIRQFNNDKFKTFYTQNDKDTISTLNVYIQTPLKYQKYIRTYSKIDSLFASVNVLIALSFMIGRVVSMIINLGEIDHYIMKRLYFFNENDEDVLETIKTEQIKICKIKKKVSDSPRLLINDFNSLIIKKTNLKNRATNCGDEEDNPFEYLVKMKNLEKNWISCFLYVIGLSDCIKLTKPNILYKHGKSLLKYDLNAILILKKLIFFESVLKVLFNEDQLNLLKVIRARYINAGMNIEEKLTKLNEMGKAVKDKCQVNDIHQSYRICCKDDDPLNKKIIKLL